MAEKENRFMNFENSMSLYRSKTAMIIGVLYFSKGYQSTPVIGMQFAPVNDPKAKEKTFAWDAEEKSWYFPTYDKCFELYNKLVKWRAQIKRLQDEKIADNSQIQEIYKDIADKQKISNPVKKKSLYMRPSYYEGTYFLQITLNLGSDNHITVAISSDELDMMIRYIGDFVTQYQSLALSHRMLMIARGRGKEGGNGGSESNGGNRSGGRSGGYTRNEGGGGRSSGSSAPNDSFGSSSSGGSKASDVDSILNGSSLDDIIDDIGTGTSTPIDADIPF